MALATLNGVVQVNPRLILGDVNDDGIVDLQDVVTLARGLVGLYEPVFIKKEASLLTSYTIAYGYPDLRDVIRLRRYLAGHDVVPGNREAAGRRGRIPLHPLRECAGDFFVRNFLCNLRCKIPQKALQCRGRGVS